MSNDQFDELLKRMPKIAETVNAFKSEQVQLLAFKMLVCNSASKETEIEHANSEQQKGSVRKPEKNQTTKKSSLKRAKSTTLSIDKNLNLKPSGKQSINEFIDEKAPSSLKEKVTACVYYLQHKLGRKDINYSHVFTCFKHLNWRLPSNLPNMMQQAGTQGWLDTSNNADIKVTPHGENLIEHDLPKKKDS
jgi:hypothetical protein